MPERKIGVILPALDEAETIGSVIDSIPIELLIQRGYKVDVTVVDGHSVDKTQEIAKSKGARVLVQRGHGKGDAIKSAFLDFKGDYLFMLDADNTYPPQNIMDMLPLLEYEMYDVVLGSRFTGQMDPGAMNTLNYVGNRLLTGLANFLYNRSDTRITDLCTGMWGFNGDVLNHLDLQTTDFQVEAEIYAKCALSGFKIGEIPVRYMRRVTPPKLNTLKDGTKIMWRLVREKM